MNLFAERVMDGVLFLVEVVIVVVRRQRCLFFLTTIFFLQNECLSACMHALFVT